MCEPSRDDIYKRGITPINSFIDLMHKTMNSLIYDTCGIHVHVGRFYIPIQGNFNDIQ